MPYNGQMVSASTTATTIPGITPNNDIAVTTAAALASKDLPTAPSVEASAEEPGAVDPLDVEVLDTAVKATRR